MGQAYCIANVTKGQYIYPHDFFHGYKLLEFGSDGGGMMLGLAILLSNGCGDGGGDLHVSYKLDPELAALVGSWAGDCVVVAGEYGEPGRFLTRKNMRQWCVHHKFPATAIEREMIVTEKWEEPDYSNNAPFKNMVKRSRDINFGLKKFHPNLYHVAQDVFENISHKVLKVMAEDRWTKDRLIQSTIHGFGSDDAPSWLKRAATIWKKKQNKHPETLAMLNEKRFNTKRQDYLPLLVKELRKMDNLSCEELNFILHELYQDSIQLSLELLKPPTPSDNLNMDWDELRKHKLTLLNLTVNENLSLEEQQHMSGVLHALDGFMDDAAERFGVETVFGDQSEEANKLREEGKLV